MAELSEADRVRVAEYRAKLDRYPRPCVTADILAVRPTWCGASEDDRRFALELLLIRRGQWPHEGCWALPGGFVGPNESVEEGARRELREETDLEAHAHPLIAVGTFSKPGRDMRAWIISSAFLSAYRSGEGCHVKGGDDAALARWMRIEDPVFDASVPDGSSSRVRGFRMSLFDGAEPVCTLRGTYEPGAFDGGRVLSVEPNPLAFDHAEIVATAFLRLRALGPRKLDAFFRQETSARTDDTDLGRYLGCGTAGGPS